VKPKDTYNDEKLELLYRSLQVPRGKGKDAVWNEIFEKLDSNTKTPIVNFWSLTGKIAAIFIGFAVISSLLWVFVFGSVKHYTPYGVHQMVFLPDSSLVRLNADSELKYNKVLWALSRKVSLKGEALFEVKRGDNFLVQTGPVSTQVLGTTFNVYARDKNIYVSCIEGKVEVKHNKTKQAYILKPKEKIATSKGALEDPKPVEKPQMANWVKGEFFFTNEQLINVLKELERQFNVKVKLNDSGNRLYTGVFSNKNLNEALDLICIPMSLEWESIDGYIVISKKND
jgi:transmembrane sensor